MTEHILLLSNNMNRLLLKKRGKPEDLSKIHRVSLNFDGVVIDSKTSPHAFNWPTKIKGELQLKLGGEIIPEGIYNEDRNIKLKIYDSPNSGGTQWGNNGFPAVVERAE